MLREVQPQITAHLASFMHLSSAVELKSAAPRQAYRSPSPTSAFYLAQSSMASKDHPSAAIESTIKIFSPFFGLSP